MHTFLTKVEEIIGGTMLAIMVAIAFCNVVTRYFLHFSMAFTEEITLYLFVWVTLLGTSIAFRDGANMAVTAVYNRFNKSGRKWLYLLGTVCSLIFLIVLGYWGIIEVIEEMEMGVTTEAIDLPVYWFTSAIPIACCFTVVRLVMKTVMDVRAGNY